MNRRVDVTDPNNETCKACPYNRMSLDGLHEDCDPPMGQCRLELEATAKKTVRCHLAWQLQANCQYARGDSYPHSECQAPEGNLCRATNAK